MARLPMLKSSMPMLGSRIPVMIQTRNPEAEQRTRGRKWMTIRARWFRDHPLCVECQRIGRVSAANRLDHVVPLIDGGANDESNFQSLCASHHDLKTAREAGQRAR